MTSEEHTHTHTGTELAAWLQLLLPFQLLDAIPFLVDGSRYTWSNNQEGQSSIQSQLDGFYLPPGPRGWHPQLVHHPRMRQFDHSLTTLSLFTPGPKLRGPGIFRLPPYLLSSPSHQKEIKDFWNAPPPSHPQVPGCLLKLEGLRLWSNVKSRELAAARKEVETRLLNSLKASQALLKRDPGSIPLQHNYTAAQESLSQHVLQNHHRFQDRIAVLQQAKSEKMTSFFFEHMQPIPEQQSIVALQKGDILLTHPRAINDHAHQYYTELLQARSVSPHIEQCRSECLCTFPTLVSQQQQQALELPFTAKEIHQAINSMASHKAPGPYGIPIEFYKLVWPMIKADFMDMLQICWQAERFPQSLNHGIISLIFKKGDRKDIAYYRPITLLNNTYKILAKAMARRLKPLLPTMISPNQTGFIAGWSILENIIVAEEVITRALALQLPIVELLLDFEKTYDRVEWDFLCQVLQVAGFGPNFLTWAKMLYKDASSSINTNGYISSPISISDPSNKDALSVRFSFSLLWRHCGTCCTRIHTCRGFFFPSTFTQHNNNWCLAIMLTTHTPHCWHS